MIMVVDFALQLSLPSSRCIVVNIWEALAAVRTSHALNAEILSGAAISKISRPQNSSSRFSTTKCTARQQPSLLWTQFVNPCTRVTHLPKRSFRSFCHHVSELHFAILVSPKSPAHNPRDFDLSSCRLLHRGRDDAAVAIMSRTHGSVAS